MYPQLEYDRLFIEKRYTCPNKIRRIHNVLLEIKESKKREENHISTLTKNPISTIIVAHKHVN